MRAWLVLALLAAATAQCYRVTSNSLSFRTGPGTWNGRVGGKEYLSAGEVLTKVGGPNSAEGYNWINLRASSGQTGWAADAWLAGVACGGSPPPPPAGGGGGGSTGCAPASSSVGNSGVLTALPAPGAGISQPYGRTAFSWSNCAAWYSAAGCMHNGIDVGVRWGTPVKAACSGQITSGTDQGGGNPMAAGPKSVVLHCGDWLVLYGHMSATQTGYRNAGDVVGLSGNPGGCGSCGNDHLHFEVRKKNSGSTTYSNNAVNPLPLFRGDLQGAMTGDSLVCQNAMTQPDVIYGQASKCKQWCGCSGYC
jgi:murein DD-endopeptidase MepM/ murein hydrolase activator NlpD